MRNAYYLVSACEDDLVLADDASASDRVYADLLRLTRLANAVAVVDIFALLSLVSNRVCYHQRRAAGSVKLLVVVLFNYLNIKIRAERASRLLCEVDDEVDAYREKKMDEMEKIVRDCVAKAK